MRRATTHCFWMLLLAGACKEKSVGLPCVVTAQCDNNDHCPDPQHCEPVTRACIDDVGATQLDYSVDAVECPSSICVLMRGAEMAACSDTCASDSDCESATNEACTGPANLAPESRTETGNFVCVQPVVTGTDLNCQKLCVCRFYAVEDGLYAPDGGHAIEPCECNPNQTRCNQ